MFKNVIVLFKTFNVTRKKVMEKDTWGIQIQLGGLLSRFKKINFVPTLPSRSQIMPQYIIKKGRKFFFSNA